jgi:hypothetical protein
MSSTKYEAAAATAAMEKYRHHDDVSVVGAALAVVGLSAERAAREEKLRDDLIRVAHSTGASIRQLAEVSGLGRRAVTAIVSTKSNGPTDRKK